MLNWPGGLDRLAHKDPAIRHRAAEELARRATPELQPLLLELFSDPDPLVREISLRGLRSTGGKGASAALVRLLNDPEPNVRAAVLKQLSEDAAIEMFDKIAAYVQKETDPDLIVHAIRYFHEVKYAKKTDSLIPLTKHASWQVRADAAAALGAAIDRYSNSTSNSKNEQIFDTLLALLADEDAFVVARSLEGLAYVNAQRAVEPLVKAATDHPSLASKIAHILANGSAMRAAALPHLREFFQREDPAARAAAIRGLTIASSESLSTEMAAALNDSDSRVRTAAAESLLQMMSQSQPDNLMRFGELDDLNELNDFSRFGQFDIPLREADPPIPEPGNPIAGFFKKLLGGGGAEKEEPTAEEPVDEPAKKADPQDPPANDSPRTVSPAEKDESEKDESGGDNSPEDPASNVSPLDQWLVEIYAGKHREEWTSELVGPLTTMLKAPDVGERHSAAMALLPLGKTSEALPVILAAAEESADAYHRSGDALAWLVWQQREEVFWSLVSTAHDEGQLAGLVSSLNSVNDTRNANVLWTLLNREEATSHVAQEIEEGILASSFGQRYFNVNSVA
ncbi:MAG: HEAT repeat domain-containing protein, partial [Pirellulaceae bacterium]|nr:HEAT repeat domain-containing protein [Pirellulaceae bacterium]